MHGGCGQVTAWGGLLALTFPGFTLMQHWKVSVNPLVHQHTVSMGRTTTSCPGGPKSSTENVFMCSLLLLPCPWKSYTALLAEEEVLFFCALEKCKWGIPQYSMQGPKVGVHWVHLGSSSRALLRRNMARAWVIHKAALHFQASFLPRGLRQAHLYYLHYNLKLTKAKGMQSNCVISPPPKALWGDTGIGKGDSLHCPGQLWV